MEKKIQPKKTRLAQTVTRQFPISTIFRISETPKSENASGHFHISLSDPQNQNARAGSLVPPSSLPRRRSSQ